MAILFFNVWGVFCKPKYTLRLHQYTWLDHEDDNIVTYYRQPVVVRKILLLYPFDVKGFFFSSLALYIVFTISLQILYNSTN